ncbi:MAG: transposase [Clostridia bacterium]
MINFKTYTYRLYPNNIQKNKIDTTIIAARLIYNKVLAARIIVFYTYRSYIKKCNEQGVQPNICEINKHNQMPSLPSIKKQYPFTKTVDSLALCAELNNVNKAFKNYNEHRCKFPTFKKTKDRNSYATSNVNNNIRIEHKRIRLPKIGFVKVRLHRELPTNAVIKRCVVFEDKCGKYYVAIVVSYEENIVKSINKDENLNNVVGLDFKMGDIYVSSDGETPKYDAPYRTMLKTLHCLESKLKRREKFSNNWYKFIGRIRRIHKFIAFKRKDFIHKLTTKLSKRYDMVAIESLNLKSIAKKVKGKIELYDTSYCIFVKRLTYKLQILGKNICKIDRWFPSSKKCSKCGNIKKKLKLNQRTYNCKKCGLSLDRDINASINIRNEGIRALKN